MRKLLKIRERNCGDLPQGHRDTEEIGWKRAEQRGVEYAKRSGNGIVDPPPIFENVWQGKELRAGIFGTVAGEGVTGGGFRPKTGETRNWRGSVARKGVSVPQRIIHE